MKRHFLSALGALYLLAILGWSWTLAGHGDAGPQGGSGGTPGGSDTHVQFNDSSAFGGDSGLTYDKTNDTLTVTGGANAIHHRVIGLTNQTNPIFSVESGDGELIYQVCDPSVSGGDTFIHRWRFDTSSVNAHWSITDSGSLIGRVNAGRKLQLVANEFVPSARLASDTILGWNANTSLTGDMDTGLIRHSAGSVKLNGYSGNGGDLVLTERSATPGTDPTDGTECRTYMKGDKFIIQYNHGATIKYRYLDLTSTDATWTYTTTAP